jgi:hypothetical protein
MLLCSMQQRRHWMQQWHHYTALVVLMIMLSTPGEMIVLVVLCLLALHVLCETAIWFAASRRVLQAGKENNTSTWHAHSSSTDKSAATAAAAAVGCCSNRDGFSSAISESTFSSFSPATSVGSSGSLHDTAIWSVAQQTGAETVLLYMSDSTMHYSHAIPQHFSADSV